MDDEHRNDAIDPSSESELLVLSRRFSFERFDLCSCVKNSEKTDLRCVFLLLQTKPSSFEK